MAELISRRLLRAFEDVCAWFGTLRTIENAFADEHVDVVDADVDGTRRGLFNELVDRVDRHDPEQAAQLLRVLETVASWVDADDGVRPSPAFEQLRTALERDGFRLDAAGRIHPPASWSRIATRVPQLPLTHLRDPAEILEHLDRLERAGDHDPALAISSAKALIEATSKHVLDELDEPYDARADMPQLVRDVQKALKLHPETIAPTVKGRETIVRILSNLSQVAVGVAELRNEYGPDHGRGGATTGLQPRHAHLAVGAAGTYVRLLLETLADRRRGSG